MPTQPSQLSQSTLSTLVDLSAVEDSDYSIGDISVITECESVHIGDPEDVYDDEVNAEEEVDVFQLCTGDQGVSEAALWSIQYSLNVTSHSLAIFHEWRVASCEVREAGNPFSLSSTRDSSSRELVQSTRKK